MSENRKYTLIYIFASTVLLYFIFAAAVNILYYAGDDYRYALGGYDKACSTDDGFYFMLTLGRPIQAYLDCLNYKFAFTLEHMRLIRWLAVLLLGCGMGLYADWLRSLRFSFWSAFFAAGSLFLVALLSFDTVLTGAISAPATLIFVLLAYRCINKAHAYALTSIIKEWGCISMSALFVFCALITYPALAFFFPTLMLSKLLFSSLSDWVKTRRELFYETILFCLVCVIYYIWAYYNMRYHAQAPVPQQYHIDHPNLNPLEMLKRFIELGNVFNGQLALFPASNMLVQGWTIIILVVSGVSLGIIHFLQGHFYRQKGKTASLYLAQALGIALLLLMLSSAFALIIPDRVDNARLLFGTLASGFVLLFWCVSNGSLIFSERSRGYVIFTIISVLFFTEGYQANVGMLVEALSFSSYLNSVKVDISHYLATGQALRRIHFIVPKTDYPYTRYFVVNGALVQLLGHGKYELTWCSLPRGVNVEEKDHQAEALACIAGLTKGNVGVTYSYEGEPYSQSSDTLVLKNQYKLVSVV